MEIPPLMAATMAGLQMLKPRHAIDFRWPAGDTRPAAMEIPPLTAATDDGLHMLGGSGLRARRRDGPASFASCVVNALARRGPSWWAIVDGREIWARGLTGRWSRKAVVPALRALCLLPTSGGVWIGTAEAHLMRLFRGELRRVSGFDAMAGRNSWFTPWGGPPDTRSLARGADRTLYVNVHVGGVACSRDRGEHWQSTINIETDVHQVIAHPSRPRTVLAATAIGLGVSSDRGTTWRFETAGFHALYQRAVALAGNIVLVSASRNERGERAAVYRRALDRGGPFERCQAGLPQWFSDNVNTHCLATEGRAAAIGTADGTVFVSGDAGKTWKVLAEGLPKVRAVVFDRERRRGAH